MDKDREAEASDLGPRIGLEAGCNLARAGKFKLHTTCADTAWLVMLGSRGRHMFHGHVST